jgi:hypothetical protein
MENSEKTIIHTVKKTWSDPEITILSVKDDTLGGGATSPDATINS